MNSFNSILQNMKPSASMAKGLSEGKMLYNLAVGSPDIPPPSQINTLIEQFIHQPDFNYQPTKGGQKAIENLLKIVDPNNHSINPNNNVVIVPGAKYGIYLSLKTLCNIGDSVVMVEPYWLSYTDICYSLSLNPIFWRPNIDNYQVNSLEKLIINQPKRPKVIIINNPINPSGYIFKDDELLEIIQLAKRLGIWVILDEVYKDLCFDPSRKLHSNFFDENLIRVGSFSKTLSIPGFRPGYVIGSNNFTKNFNLLHQHIATSIHSITAFILKNIDSEIYHNYTKQCSLIYKERYEFVFKSLIEKGYKPLKSEGTFYMLVDIENKFQDGSEACEKLEEKGIILTPGVNYGETFNNTVRICLTKDLDTFKKIIELI